MNANAIFKSPALKKAGATFLAGYAKRMMEGHYTRLMETEVGRRATQMSRPSKYAVEAVLNGIAAYLSTKEGTIANTPVKEFLWEVAKDAPSEISKRLLNGDHATSAGVIDTSTEDRQTVLDGLLRLDANDLGTFLSWLENASPEERHQMAEAMSKLTEEEQKKLLVLTPDQARNLFASSFEPTAPKQMKRSPEAQADLDAAHRRVDEELARNREKRKA